MPGRLSDGHGDGGPLELQADCLLISSQLLSLCRLREDALGSMPRDA